MSDIAVQFAIEIIGWKEAYRSKGVVFARPYVFGKGFANNFHCYDIRKILKLVSWYCKKVGTTIDLNVLYDPKPAEALMRECLSLKRLLDKSNEA